MSDALGTGYVDVRARWDDGQAEQAIGDGVEGAARRNESKTRNVGAAIGRTMVAGFAAVWAGGKAFDVAMDLRDLGFEVEAWQTKTDTVFGEQASSVRAWADENNEALGLTEERLAGLAARAGDLLVPMGFARNEAADMSTDILDLSGALSAWSEGQFESAEVADILTKALLGERDQLKALGVSISEADVQARLAAKGQQDLTGQALEQAKAQATLELITEKTTDAQAAWSDGTFDAVKQQNELKATIDGVKQSIAVALLPAFQAVTAWIVEEAIPAVREWWPVFVEAFDQIVARGKELAAWFMEDLWPTISEALVAIQEIVTEVVAVISALWAEFGDEVLAYTQNTWDQIMVAVETAVEVITGILQTISALLRGEWGEAWDALRGAIGAAMSGAWELVKLNLERIGILFGAVWDGIVIVVSGAIDALIGFVAGIGNRVTTAIAGAFDPILNGLRSVWNRIADFINGVRFTFEGVNMPGPIPDVPGFTVDPIPTIPRLADGTVVNDPMLALIGESARANPEVVSPVALMASTFRDVLREGQQAAPVSVRVFIGDEELDARTVRVVDDRFAGLARTITAGVR